jgi:hypothetical protein
MIRSLADRIFPNGYEVVPGGDDFFFHVGRIFVKQMQFVHAGQAAITHAHKFDHVTLLVHGVVALETDGDTTVYDATEKPCVIDVPAGVHHSMVCLSDSALALCIHDTHGLDPDDLSIDFMKRE